MAPLIKMQGVSRIYGTAELAFAALSGVSLSIEVGEYVAIMGPSGSGKSTLMNILGILDHPTGGSYFFGDEDVGTMQADEMARHRNRNFGFVFQGFNLLPRASAIENVALPLTYRGVKNVDRIVIAAKSLQSVGLAGQLHKKPQELSGGEQQRVAIARALATDPIVLLADEPTGSLDTETGNAILDLFEALNDAGQTIILVTHDQLVARRARRLIRMRDGRIMGDDLTKPRSPSIL